MDNEMDKIIIDMDSIDYKASYKSGMKLVTKLLKQGVKIEDLELLPRDETNINKYYGYKDGCTIAIEKWKKSQQSGQPVKKHMPIDRSEIRDYYRSRGYSRR